MQKTVTQEPTPTQISHELRMPIVALESLCSDVETLGQEAREIFFETLKRLRALEERCRARSEEEDL